MRLISLASIFTSLSFLSSCSSLREAADAPEVDGTSSTGLPDESTTGVTPTSTASAGGSSTGEPDATTTTTTDEDSTGTAVPPDSECYGYKNRDDCLYDKECRWASLFELGRGVGGCNGDIVDLCVEKRTGEPSTWYRGDGPNAQVVLFDHTPQGLSAEWRPCDCDGPIACFCAPDSPECPERVQDFCGVAGSEAACSSSLILDEPRCGWFKISREGPKDDACTQQPFKNVCLAADSAGADSCAKSVPPYPQCSDKSAPVYYREVDGQIEVTSSCGPVPPSPEWTACGDVDTPEQPDECGCTCV